MALGVSNPEPTYDMRSEETQIYALELLNSVSKEP